MNIEQQYMQPDKNKVQSTEIEIIFNDTSASEKHNKELVKYFKNNLDTLNKYGIKFVWRIATKEEYPLYKQRGIINYPAVVIPPKQVIFGVNNILKGIAAYINKRKEYSTSLSSLSNGLSAVSDEALYEYQRRAIRQGGDDEPDSRDNFDSDFRRKQSEMARRRKAAGMAVSDQTDNGGGGMNTDLTIGMNDDELGYARSDNINPMKIDPLDSLARLRRNNHGPDAQDADLMQIQLEKMGGGDSISLDYY
jgi:hypothetical protein